MRAKVLTMASQGYSVPVMDTKREQEDAMNTIDPTDSRSMDQAVMMGMPGPEDPCAERIANAPDGVQPCHGCTLECPHCVD